MLIFTDSARYEDGKAIEETLFLSNIPGMIESIEEGRKEAIQSCTSIDEVE